MICHMENMILSSIREIFSSAVNDVFICRDLNSPTGACYTLLVVKDRTCTRKLISVFENSEKIVQKDSTPFICSFSENEFLYYLFDYRPERRLSLFAEGQMVSSYEWEEICINLVMECLSCALPYPLLYLVLNQDNIQLEKDNSIYFTLYFDLSELDVAKDEASCADLCVKLMLGIFQNKTKKKLKSFELLQKKEERNAYRDFPELYRDIRITQNPYTKIPIFKRMKSLWQKNKDQAFRILLVLSVTLVILALIVLISQVIFGNVPVFRIFERCFDKIGTEKLN